jgi:hypothetical protein
MLVDLEVVDRTAVLEGLRILVRSGTLWYTSVCLLQSSGSLMRKKNTNWGDMFCPFIDNERKGISPFT